MIKKALLRLWVMLSLAGCASLQTALFPPAATPIDPLAENKALGASCVKAFALVAGIDEAQATLVAQVALSEKLDDFTAKEPAVKDGKIFLEAFVPDVWQRGSEYPQIWCKLPGAELIKAQQGPALSGNPLRAKGCNEVSRAFFQDTLSRESGLERAWLKTGYDLSFANAAQNSTTAWSSFASTLINQGKKSLLMTSSSLDSTPSGGGAPHGILSCKLFAPEAYGQIVRDVAAVNFDRIPFADPSAGDPQEAWGPDLVAGEVSFDGVFWEPFPRKAIVVYAPGVPLKGTYVISPEGAVPALAMRVFVKSMAKRGQVVFIVRYPRDLSNIETVTIRHNSAVNLGAILHSRQIEKLSGMPEPLVKFFRAEDKPLRLFGYSLGGSILGEAIFGEQNVFDDVILYGTTSFIDGPWQKEIRANRLHSIIGAADGVSLAALGTFDAYRKGLKATEQLAQGVFKQPKREIFAELLPGYNHFCLVGDMNVGAPYLRAKDQKGPAPSLCASGLIRYFEGRGLL